MTQGFLSIRSKEMSKVLVTTRVVSVNECPWLDADIPAGTPVWTYEGHTYGVVTPSGIAVTAKAAETPFFELPMDAF
jgi:hypothetical protein